MGGAQALNVMTIDRINEQALEKKKLLDCVYGKRVATNSLLITVAAGKLLFYMQYIRQILVLRESNPEY